MTSPLIENHEAIACFRYWRAGLCPCCGSELEAWIDGTEPAVIAEDVELCGRCIANQHDRTEEKRELLGALVRGRQLVEARG